MLAWFVLRIVGFGLTRFLWMSGNSVAPNVGAFG